MLEGVNDLTEEEARALARELGLDDEAVEEAIVANRVVQVPLGPSPGEVPLLAQSLKGSGAGPVVDEAEFRPPPSDDSGPSATHGELSPSKAVSVPLSSAPALSTVFGTNATAGPALDTAEFAPPPKTDSGPGPVTGQLGSPPAKDGSDVPTSPVQMSAPLMHDPTELPTEVVAEALDVPGDAPVVDEAEFTQPPDTEEGPGPVTGQLKPAQSPASPDQIVSLAEISPVPQKPAPATAPPPPLEPLPSAEAVSVLEGNEEDEEEVVA